MSKVIVNGQEVQPAVKKKLPAGTRIADLVPPYVPPVKNETPEKSD